MLKNVENNVSNSREDYSSAFKYKIVFYNDAKTFCNDHLPINHERCDANGEK